MGRLRGAWMRIPETPSWRMIIVLLILMCLGAFALLQFSVGVRTSVNELGDTVNGVRTDVKAVQDGQAASRERGYINRAVGCMGLIIDNDRDFPLTSECTDPNVAAYYPQAVCIALPIPVQGCGIKATYDTGNG